METSTYSIADCRGKFQEQIDRWISKIIDADVVVDDRRRELDTAVDAFRAAVRERDRTARHLQRLIDWAADVDGDRWMYRAFCGAQR